MKLEALSPLGAQFAPRQIGDVTLAEMRDNGAVLVTATGPLSGDLTRLSKTLAVDLPRVHGATATDQDRRAIWLTPRSWIVTCAPGDEKLLVDNVALAFPDHTVLASPYSDALCWLSLDGGGAEDLLRQGSFLSFSTSGLPVGHAKRTLVAGIPAVVQRRGETAWTIAVERSRAHFFVDWLNSLTHSFGDT